jgi:hypothetical protein
MSDRTYTADDHLATAESVRPPEYDGVRGRRRQRSSSFLILQSSVGDLLLGDRTKLFSYVAYITLDGKMTELR